MESAKILAIKLLDKSQENDQTGISDQTGSSVQSSKSDQSGHSSQPSNFDLYLPDPNVDKFCANPTVKINNQHFQVLEEGLPGEQQLLLEDQLDQENYKSKDLQSKVTQLNQNEADSATKKLEDEEAEKIENGYENGQSKTLAELFAYGQDLTRLEQNYNSWTNQVANTLLNAGMMAGEVVYDALSLSVDAGNKLIFSLKSQTANSPIESVVDKNKVDIAKSV